MDLGLRGMRVAITGGSRGIGLACAHAFAHEGASPLLIARDSETLQQAVRAVADRNGVAAKGVRCDLSDPADRRRTLAELDRADVVVNNAGDAPWGHLPDVTEDQIRAAFELKLFGYLEVARWALTGFHAAGSGVLINVIGAGGHAPQDSFAIGASINAALIALTEAGGGFPRRDGVRVVGLSPGAVMTERLQKLMEQRAYATWRDSSKWTDVLPTSPPPATPDEIADVVVMLASKRARHVDRTVLLVNGGR